MDENLNNFIYSKDAIEFLTVASEYCGFVEKVTKFNKIDFIKKSQKLFALLYLKTSLLPDFEKNEEGDLEKFVTEADYLLIQESIAAKYGSDDVFVHVFEPLTQETDDPVELNLSECYADIYQDLKDFILNFQSGSSEAMIDALWECKLNFENFWGPRLLVALVSIHNLSYNSGIDDENDDEDLTEDTQKTNSKSKKSTNFLKNHYKSFNKDSEEFI
jgi:hypothetical protein